jgi:sugar phosphate isomerase/epimerase
MGANLMELNRRHLLAGFSALSLTGFSANAAVIKQPYQKMGLQLYTVRDAFATDPVGTLQKVRGLGYDYVEAITFGGMAPTVLKVKLTEIGLGAPSMHIGLADWQNRPEAALDDLAALGADCAVLAWMPPEERKEWKSLAGKINSWAALAKARGLKFAYHNHDFEFTKTPEGEMPYHLLLENTDPALVGFELDCYWASFAGHDPLHILKEHGDRIRMLHLKDKAADGAMAPVGEGTIDFGAVLSKANELGIRYAFVEHDNPTDPWASIATSIRNLKG